MRLRSVLVLLVILALLVTAAGLGVAGAIASRDGWFDDLRDLSFGGNYHASQSGPPISRTFPVTSPLSVDVKIDDGEVRIITGGVTATVIVTPTAQASSDSELARAIASIKPDIRYADGVLSVNWHGDADPRPRRFDGRSVEVVIQVPSAVSSTVSVATRAADIEVRDIRGPVTVATAFGDLRLDRLQGAVSATTAAGDITVDGIRGAGALSLRSEFGDVQLRDVQAGTVRAETSAGDILALDTMASAAGGIVARTGFGDIQLDYTTGNPTTADSDGGDVSVAPRRLTGPVNATSKFGDVEVTLPKGAGAEASLMTRFGLLTAPFIHGDIEDLDHDKPQTGRVGGGGPRVTLSTEGGDVRLLQAAESR